MSRASSGPDTPQRTWNNIPDLLRIMPVELSVKDGMICYEYLLVILI